VSDRTSYTPVLYGFDRSDDASNALFNIHWIPRQVKVKRNAGELEVDSFPPAAVQTKTLGPLLSRTSVLLRVLSRDHPPLEQPRLAQYFASISRDRRSTGPR
jgi:hypothetical protein